MTAAGFAEQTRCKRMAYVALLTAAQKLMEEFVTGLFMPCLLALEAQDIIPSLCGHSVHRG